jgi:N-glycosylase/DNA lyase
MNHSERIADLHRLHAERGELIRSRLAEFAAVPQELYFYELLYCLLTPQSSAEHADKVVTILRNSDAEHADLPFASILRQKEHYIRFHNTKARHILLARKSISDINTEIEHTSDAAALRAWLVANVKGLGWKEASHFLRNIGRRDLAILDRHILRNLLRFRVIREMPTSLPPSRYFSIEESFKRFAAKNGISMDELDLLFWSRETGRIMK